MSGNTYAHNHCACYTRTHTHTRSIHTGIGQTYLVLRGKLSHHLPYSYFYLQRPKPYLQLLFAVSFKDLNVLHIYTLVCVGVRMCVLTIK